ANSSIFYDRATGQARSLAQVRDVLTARYDVARNDAVRAAQAASAASAAGATVSPGTLSVAQATGAPLDLAAFAAPAAAAAPSPGNAAPAKTAAAAVPETAGMTSAFAAATPTPAAQAANQIFHGLFQDTDRTAPVA